MVEGIPTGYVVGHTINGKLYPYSPNGAPYASDNRKEAEAVAELLNSCWPASRSCWQAFGISPTEK